MLNEPISSHLKTSSTQDLAEALTFRFESEVPQTGVGQGRRRRCRLTRGLGRRREEGGHERGLQQRGWQRARRGTLPAQLRDAAPAHHTLEPPRARPIAAARPGGPREGEARGAHGRGRRHCGEGEQEGGGPWMARRK